MIAPISHGSQRIHPEAPRAAPATTSAAAVPVRCAAPAAAAPLRSAALAAAAPARCAVLAAVAPADPIAAPADPMAVPAAPIAAAALPPSESSSDDGLAKPSALVSRRSSVPCRNWPWPASRLASPLAPSPFSPTNFLMNPSTIGASSASRLDADWLLRNPATEPSVPASAPALSPSNDPSRPPPALVSGALFCPPPSKPDRFASAPVLTAGLSSSDIRLCAPSAVEPFCAIAPTSAGSAAVNAVCVAPGDSPTTLPARSEKSPGSPCLIRSRRLVVMKPPLHEVTTSAWPSAPTAATTREGRSACDRAPRQRVEPSRASSRDCAARDPDKPACPRLSMRARSR